MADNRTETRIARAAVVLSAMLVVALGFLAWRITRPVELADLSDADRVRLLQRADGIAPPVFQPYPPAGPTLFYHLQPQGRYEGAFGADFVANELGFRSPPLSARAGRKRLLLVGDSWTFSPHVENAQTLTAAVARALDAAQENAAQGATQQATQQGWEVQNLSMIGWNLDNQLAALRAFVGTLAPDLVVFCTTSNDIDDGFSVWKGHLVSRGFDSGALFKPSYEYERRWVAAFDTLDRTAGFLAAEQIPSFVYFMAEWRGLAPYYAARADFDVPYSVVPTPYIETGYLLPPEVDPAQHPSAAGYAKLASHLVAALAGAGLLEDTSQPETEFAPRYPGSDFDPEVVRAEFEFWWPRASKRPRGPFYDGHMGLEAFVSAVSPPGTTELELRFTLVDEPALFPLDVAVELAGGESRSHRFERYEAGEQRISLPLPEPLRSFPAVEARVTASRIVSRPPALLPMSIRQPQLVASGS